VSQRLATVLCHPVPYFARFYAEAARVEGLELRVLYACRHGTEEYFDPGFGRAVRWEGSLLDGYDHEFLPIAREPKSFGFREVDNPLVGERLAAFAPDVVMLHGYAHATLWRAAAWGRRTGTPSMIYSDSHGGAATSLWKRLLKYPVVRTFYGMLDGAFTTGANNREYHLRYGLPAERLLPGLLPVDDASIRAAEGGDPAVAAARARRELGLPADAFIVLFLGKFVVHKRVADLLDAAEILARRGEPIHLVLSGDGPLRADLERRALTLPPGSVTFTGFLDAGRVAAPLLACDVLVLPSERDALGAVVGEALVAGRPSVVSDRVGCLEAGGFAVEGETALSYPCGDVVALAERLHRLRTDVPLRLRMAAAARVRGREVGPGTAARLLATAAARIVEMGPRITPRVRAAGRDG
jgi:glycosyltransferase involved in cell wall biosynthesis